ncbi:MAG: ABC transporter permease, partial [Pseudomonadota bacterium]
RAWTRAITSASSVGGDRSVCFDDALINKVIDDMGGLSYLAFVVPGMMAYSAMFAASFETSIGAFARFNMQRTWDAVLATPVSLAELLLGELFWAASKAMLSAVCVLIIGFLWGGVGSLTGALLSLPLIFIGSCAFAAAGLAATAYAKSWEFFSYFFTFWVTPMFVFSGVFFSVDRFPSYVEPITWILPMTHLIQIVRPLTAGTGVSVIELVGHLSYLILLVTVGFTLAYRRLRVRMFD